MMSPFLVLNREVAVFDLALRQASAELNRSRGKRRRRRLDKKSSDRRW